MKLESRLKLNPLYFSERDGRHLVVAIENGKWITCSQQTINLLHVIEEKQLVGEVLKAVPLPEEYLMKELEKYFKLGFIQVDGLEYAPKFNMNKQVAETFKSPSLCILHVSNVCNLACKYCYAHTESTEKNRMSLETMLKAVERFMELPSKMIAIEFHGGEPLMQYKNIREACEYAIKLGEEKCKKVIFSMQSNMTFLPPECVELIKKYDIRIRISLDGLKEMNDYYRVDHNGEGSFDKIMHNLSILRAEGIYPEVVSVVNKRNVDCLPEMFKLYAELNLRNVRLMPFWSQGMGVEIDSDAVEPKYLAEKYMEIIKWLVAYNRKQENKDDYMKMLVLSKEVEALSTNKRSFMCLRCPCGAGVNMVDISINGDIYPCEEMNEQKAMKVGNIFEGPIMDFLEKAPVIKQLKARTPDNVEECSTCQWKRHCQSGCANKNYQRYGKFESKSDKCDFYKKYFEDLIWYMDQDREAIKYMV